MNWFWKRLCAFVTRMAAWFLAVFGGKITLGVLLTKVAPAIYTLPFAAKVLWALWSAAFWTWLVCFLLVAFCWFSVVDRWLVAIGWLG